MCGIAALLECKSEYMCDSISDTESTNLYSDDETNSMCGIALLECKSEYMCDSISDTESTNLYSDDEEEDQSDDGEEDQLNRLSDNGEEDQLNRLSDNDIFYDSESYSDKYLNDYKSNVDSDEFIINNEFKINDELYIDQKNKNYYPLRLSNTDSCSNNSEYNEEEDNKYYEDYDKYDEEYKNDSSNTDISNDNSGLKYILENDYYIFYQYIKKIELLKMSNLKQYNIMNKNCILLNLKNIQNAFFDLLELYT